MVCSQYVCIHSNAIQHNYLQPFAKQHFPSDMTEYIAIYNVMHYYMVLELIFQWKTVLCNAMQCHTIVYCKLMHNTLQ